jgi:hypothetical protein
LIHTHFLFATKGARNVFHVFFRWGARREKKIIIEVDWAIDSRGKIRLICVEKERRRK